MGEGGTAEGEGRAVAHGGGGREGGREMRKWGAQRARVGGVNEEA